MSQEAGGFDVSENMRPIEYTVEAIQHPLVPPQSYEVVAEQQIYQLGYLLGRNAASQLFISEQSMMQVENAVLLHEAEHDIVTELPAERRFRRIAEDMIRNNPDKPWGLGMIDLGNFKLANEHELGHARGDDVLRSCGITFKRATDLVARIGGDEFMFLVDLSNGDKRSSDPKEELERVIDMVRAARGPVIEDHADLDEGDIRFFVSVDAVIYDRDLSYDENKAHADRAMMAVKQQETAIYGAFRPIKKPDTI